ncbi:SpoIIE family protein phosphatase [Kitasatospora sp. CM 4170]|uniref:SpoIIE family protein phosphatase n=1 Tax=Kitasatospora aburaviensis TaxID=67265 RepID=A0ABW1ET29_9ACTN|nr:SpoIIE family protein phosphatase [Kitasatospora sp. CM 4170]WNM43977.1 SpoIIE family protein phosphatase [Kitasatospora sp. CM 4170]
MAGRQADEPATAVVARELAETVRRLQQDLDRLRAEEPGRSAVDLATGILAERLRCSPDEAAVHLARLAREAGVRPADLAADIAGRPGATVGGHAAAAGRRSDDEAPAASGTPPGDRLAGPASLPPAPALAAVPDLQQAAEAVLDQTARPLGSSAVAIWQQLPGGVLVLAAHAGIGAAEAENWSRVPPGVDTPAGRVVRSGRALWPEPAGGAAGAGAVDAAGRPEGPGAAEEPGALNGPGAVASQARAGEAERAAGAEWGSGARERAEDPGAPAPRGPGDRAVLPLIDGGRCRGALELRWPGPAPALTQSLRRQLHALAELCAGLLGESAPAGPAGPEATADRAGQLLDGLLTPGLLLAPVLRDGELVDFRIDQVNANFRDPLGRPRTALEGTTLLESYPTASATGLFDRLQHAHRTGEPQPAELLHLVFQSGSTPLPATVRIAVAPWGRRLLASWQVESDRSGEGDQAALLRQAQRIARVCGFEEHAATGRILWNEGLREIYGLPAEADPVPLARLADHVHPDDAPAVRRLLDSVQRRHRTSAAVFRLVHPDGTQRYTRVVAEPVLDEARRVTGVRGAYQDVSSQRWTEVALGATRERLADSEQETAESEQLALRLQQAILPAEPPPLGATGLSAAVRYRPAAKRDRVGGDWYDVMPLPGGRVLLAVGDVAGHGVGAATGMVALRHALRGLAVTGVGPGRLLEWVNTLAFLDPAQVTATAACVLIDPAAGEIRWARAGHLPPIRLGADGAHVLPQPLGVLLGALEDAEYEESTARLASGEVLLLYTDGLVERRDLSVEESVDQLLRAAGAPGADLERYLDLLLEVSPSDTDDDTCLIAVRVE